MRVLVLGATGFLGGHLTRLLRAERGILLRTAGRGPGADLHADLATVTVPGLAALLTAAAPDAVVNCAGAVGGGPRELSALNSRLPAVLCAALDRAAPGARLVHLGSAAEYGRVPHGERVREDAPAAPLGHYGASKLAGTLTVTASGADAVVLRVTNPVGAGAPEAGLPGRLAAALRRAAANGPGTVVRVGDLSAHRDFVDVRDVARAVHLALRAPGPLPGVVNIGSGEAVRVRELATALLAIAGSGGHLREEAGGGSARSGQVDWSCADVTRAATALGWRPRHSLTDSLTALWEESGQETAGADGNDKERTAGRAARAGGPGAGGPAAGPLVPRTPLAPPPAPAEEPV
ncbi:NAD(P)-dependent oxidoreductase [Streptomyces sp. LD120]|uniref:NAD(P)-dependent oxidoreductase n=2 Tax=Streptomyces physcomitrii TaxID=2724184 RepID=A0ABX1H8T3_9ACTN|nr:NAD(P)-dependent oxidoreductase [Streptomyces physcomitrii]NKI44467.1 NAD(P)-dependent oxidoreductase [Streptomyces physcomitrii]